MMRSLRNLLHRVRLAVTLNTTECAIIVRALWDLSEFSTSHVVPLCQRVAGDPQSDLTTVSAAMVLLEKSTKAGPRISHESLVEVAGCLSRRSLHLQESTSPDASCHTAILVAGSSLRIGESDPSFAQKLVAYIPQVVQDASIEDTVLMLQAMPRMSWNEGVSTLLVLHFRNCLKGDPLRDQQGVSFVEPMVGILRAYVEAKASTAPKAISLSSLTFPVLAAFPNSLSSEDVAIVMRAVGKLRLTMTQDLIRSVSKRLCSVAKDMSITQIGHVIFALSKASEGSVPDACWEAILARAAEVVHAACPVVISPLMANILKLSLHNRNAAFDRNLFFRAKELLLMKQFTWKLVDILSIFYGLCRLVEAHPQHLPPEGFAEPVMQRLMGEDKVTSSDISLAFVALQRLPQHISAPCATALLKCVRPGCGWSLLQTAKVVLALTYLKCYHPHKCATLWQIGNALLSDESSSCTEEELKLFAKAMGICQVSDASLYRNFCQKLARVAIETPLSLPAMARILGSLAILENAKTEVGAAASILPLIKECTSVHLVSTKDVTYLLLGLAHLSHKTEEGPSVDKALVKFVLSLGETLYASFAAKDVANALQSLAVCRNIFAGDVPGLLRQRVVTLTDWKPSEAMTVVNAVRRLRLTSDLYGSGIFDGLLGPECRKWVNSAGTKELASVLDAIITHRVRYHEVFFDAVTRRLSTIAHTASATETAQIVHALSKLNGLPWLQMVPQSLIESMLRHADSVVPLMSLQDLPLLLWVISDTQRRGHPHAELLVACVERVKELMAVKSEPSVSRVERIALGLATCGVHDRHVLQPLWEYLCRVRRRSANSNRTTDNILHAMALSGVRNERLLTNLQDYAFPMDMRRWKCSEVARVYRSSVALDLSSEFQAHVRGALLNLLKHDARIQDLVTTLEAVKGSGMADRSVTTAVLTRIPSALKLKLHTWQNMAALILILKDLAGTSSSSWCTQETWGILKDALQDVFPAAGASYINAKELEEATRVLDAVRGSR